MATFTHIGDSDRHEDRGYKILLRLPTFRGTGVGKDGAFGHNES
jgi:hypothetical protein